LDDHDEPVVLETANSLFNSKLFEKYSISSIHHANASIFEDISYLELLDQYMQKEIYNKVRRLELNEKKNIGILKERL
jgi:hypothetical protein